MAFLLPISIPDILIRERGVVPANDFAHRHESIAFAPSGRAYLFSTLFYNYYRYDNADNRDLNVHIVTMFDRAWNVERVVILDGVMRDLTRDDKGEYVFNNSLAQPTLTPAGDIVFTTSKLRGITLDGDLARTGTVDPGTLLVTPDGTRIVVRDGDILEIDGTTCGSLMKDDGSYASRVEFSEYRGYAGEVTALDRDRICISHYASMSRGGFLDHGAFRYTILDHAGAIVARIPLGEADSPYRPTAAPHHGCFPMRALDGWMARSESAIHLFDRDGTRTLRLGLVDDLEPIQPLALLGAAPTGELIFVHRKHNLLVVTDPVRAPTDLEPALRAIALGYKAEYARLKKAVPWEKSRFLGFEAKSTPLGRGTPATKPKAKKPAKGAKAAVPVEIPEPPATSDPGTAMANAPFDLESVAVYGDWLGQQGDTLGEYVTLKCQIARDPDAPDRRRLVGLANAMWRERGDKWLARWNDPVKVFENRHAEFGGLPSAFKIESSQQLADVDRQVAHLPIQHMTIRDLGAKAIARFTELAVFRRTPGLIVSAGSKTKLGSTLLEVLTEANLVQLRDLYLYPVETSPKNLRALLATMPSLTKLHLSKCDLTYDAIVALADTDTAQRLETLAIPYNPLGSAVVPLLAKFPRVRDLSLHNCDIGDDVAKEPVEPTNVEILDVDDCDRLGAIALATLVRVMPKLREIELGRNTTPAHIDALLPIAGTLEALDLSWAPTEALAAVVAKLLPHAPKLRAIKAYYATGLAGAMVAHAPLHKLELGGLTDADVRAIAASRNTGSIHTLELDGGYDSASLVEIATSAHLANVRDLDVQSATIDPVALRAALDMPALEQILIANATIDDAEPLCQRAADLHVITVRCKIGKRAKAGLAAYWGNLYT